MTQDELLTIFDLEDPLARPNLSAALDATDYVVPEWARRGAKYIQGMALLAIITSAVLSLIQYGTISVVTPLIGVCLVSGFILSQLCLDIGARAHNVKIVHPLVPWGTKPRLVINH